MREHRPRYSEYSEEQKRRRYCRGKAFTYLLRGKIQRKPCEICGERAHMHHDDYSKPLEVRWFCFLHHEEHHHNDFRSTSNASEPGISLNP
jgi:hypothetical protein